MTVTARYRVRREDYRVGVQADDSYGRVYVNGEVYNPYQRPGGDVYSGAMVFPTGTQVTIEPRPYDPNSYHPSRLTVNGQEMDPAGCTLTLEHDLLIEAEFGAGPSPAAQQPQQPEGPPSPLPEPPTPPPRTCWWTARPWSSRPTP